MRVLISGASIAGPVLAYWLTRRGFDVTVVERAPALRKTGGHAVDLFRPAMDISEQMGVLPRIEAHKTGTDRLTVHRPWASRPARDRLPQAGRRDVRPARRDHARRPAARSTTTPAATTSSTCSATRSPRSPTTAT